jgi:hypothetical protein
MLIPAKYHSWILVEANFGHHVPQNEIKKPYKKLLHMIFLNSNQMEQLKHILLSHLDPWIFLEHTPLQSQIGESKSMVSKHITYC